MKTAKVFLILFALSIGMTVKAQDPVFEFVMELRVKIDQPFSVGKTPKGQRTIIPITGGTFEGPKLKGEILSSGADYQLSDEATHRTEVEAIYCIRTDDGVNIHVRNCGLITMQEGGFYFVTSPRFEAPKDSKYNFLNNATFICKPGKPVEGALSLMIWMVK